MDTIDTFFDFITKITVSGFCTSNDYDDDDDDVKRVRIRK